MKHKFKVMQKIALLSLILATVGLSGFKDDGETLTRKAELRYHVASSMEFDKYGKPTGSWVISNVAHVKCKNTFESMTSTEFRKHYDAFYKKDRDGAVLLDINVSRYETADQAEKARREKIASTVDAKQSPFLIKDFKVLCDE